MAVMSGECEYCGETIRDGVCGCHRDSMGRRSPLMAERRTQDDEAGPAVLAGLVHDPQVMELLELLPGDNAPVWIEELADDMGLSANEIVRIADRIRDVGGMRIRTYDGWMSVPSTDWPAVKYALRRWVKEGAAG